VMRDEGLRETEFLHDAGDGFLSIAHASKNPQAVFIGETLGEERNDLEVLGREQGGAAGDFNHTQFFLLSRSGSFQQFSLGDFPHRDFRSIHNGRQGLRALLEAGGPESRYPGKDG
jgi:hypothetical protein